MVNLVRLLPRSLKPWLWLRLSQQMHLRYSFPSGVHIRIASYSDWCMYNDIFVGGEYDRAIHAALDRAEVGQTFRIVDLGANVGFFTMRVIDLIHRRHTQFEHIDCVLVEASARLLPSLHEHLDKLANKIITPNIVIGLVGNKTGAGNLSLAASECMNQVVEDEITASLSVPYYDLDEALDPGAKIDILKCDIEGSERDFLRNYPHLLDNTEVAVFEFHEPQCPVPEGTQIVMNAGFAASHLLLDQGHAQTIFFER